MPLERKKRSTVFKEFFVVGITPFEIYEAKRLQNEARKNQSNADASLQVDPATLYTHIKQGA